jgi:hypothetical protein
MVRSVFRATTYGAALLLARCAQSYSLRPQKSIAVGFRVKSLTGFVENMCNSLIFK